MFSMKDFQADLRFFKKTKYIFLIFLCLSLISVKAWAFQSFVVNTIRVQGTQRVSRATVLSYLPFHTGGVFTTALANKTIHILYETGFFENITLAKFGNHTLAINLQERPTIGSIKISGNSEIPTTKIKALLKSVNLERGQILDRSILITVQEELQQTYFSQGRFNAKIKVLALPLPRNRVAIKIKIYEGTTLTVKGISIVGNHVFSEDDLLDVIPLTTPGLLTWLNHKDQYSEQKLNKSVEAITKYYLNRGYVEFRVLSTQVSMTPDRKYVYLTIRVHEGHKYTVSGIGVMGHYIYPRHVILSLIHIHKGEIFARAKVMAAFHAIADKIGELGYAYPVINVLPQLNKKARLIHLTFRINPGHRVYVHKISFTGNYRTSDVVMRRQLRQFEGALYNTKNIRRSIRRLNLLGYFKTVHVKTEPVPNAPDQVDLHFHVKEMRSGQFTFGVGYSTFEKFLINAGIQENNFLGTGDVVGFHVMHSLYQQSYSFNYTNPFYTINGVSRGISLYYNRTSPEAIKNLANYTMDELGGSVNYGFPISDNSYFSLGYGARNLRILTSSNTPVVIKNFVGTEGAHFTQLMLTAGWIYNGYNRAIFPTSGLYTILNGSLNSNVTGSAMYYYKLNYFIHWYYPLGAGFIWSSEARLAYGDSFAGPNRGLPFFENYFAGGIKTIRGYGDNTIGPQILSPNGQSDSIGGNALIFGSFGLIFPTPLNKYNLRTTAFIDAGNVYQTNNAFGFKTAESAKNGGRGSGPVRLSAGIGFQWYSPIGPFTVSIAFPLNAQRGDIRQVPQFTVGTSI